MRINTWEPLLALFWVVTSSICLLYSFRTLRWSFPQPILVCDTLIISFFSESFPSFSLSDMFMVLCPCLIPKLCFCRDIWQVDCFRVQATLHNRVCQGRKILENLLVEPTSTHKKTETKILATISRIFPSWADIYDYNGNIWGCIQWSLL